MLGLFPSLHLSVGRSPCGAALVEKASVILLWGVKKCGGNHKTWRSDRWLSWKTALQRALCLGHSCKRGSPVGTALSLLKHRQSSVEIPISLPDGTEICSDASEIVLASAYSHCKIPLHCELKLLYSWKGDPKASLAQVGEQGVSTAQSRPERETQCCKGIFFLVFLPCLKQWTNKPCCRQCLWGDCIGEDVQVPCSVRSVPHLIPHLQQPPRGLGCSGINSFYLLSVQ